MVSDTAGTVPQAQSADCALVVAYLAVRSTGASWTLCRRRPCRVHDLGTAKRERSVPAGPPRLVPAEPVVMNTGVFGTVMPALSTLVERAPNSARALDSGRDAWAFFENVFGAAGVAVGSD